MWHTQRDAGTGAVASRQKLPPTQLPAAGLEGGWKLHSGLLRRAAPATRLALLPGFVLWNKEAHYYYHVLGEFISGEGSPRTGRNGVIPFFPMNIYKQPMFKSAYCTYFFFFFFYGKFSVLCLRLFKARLIRGFFPLSRSSPSSVVQWQQQLLFFCASFGTQVKTATFCL